MGLLHRHRLFLYHASFPIVSPSMSRVIEHADKISKDIETLWDKSITPELIDYIKIPCKSPLFDANWKQHGHIDHALLLIKNWCEKQPLKGMTLDIIELPGRTPLLFIEIPGEAEETVLLYGHMDKQPEMTGWDPDCGPWKPVLKDDKLYGRGGADDGYAVFASLSAISLLQKYHIPHARCVIIIEACEESGSYDLPPYLDHLKDRIGNPNFIVCLDSGCGNYEQLWCTTSLRGFIGGNLTIRVLSEGIHSGIGSGVVPSPVIILRQLLDRIENKETSEVTLKELNVNIPKERLSEIQEMADLLGDAVYKSYPFLPGVMPLTGNIAELLLNRTWRPKLSVLGMNGLPPTESAGNVSIPNLCVRISIRIPPTADPKKGIAALKKLLEKDPPFGAQVEFTPKNIAPGWNAPKLGSWLKEACHQASEQFFGKPMAFMGEGGTIPFMGMLGNLFPEAQFLITGVLGPKSNAHGPNEFLHIPTAKRLTACVASALSAHYEEFH